MKFFILFVMIAMLLLSNSPVRAQQKGHPGHFDFYLLNIVPSTQFCTVEGVGKICHARPRYWLHGLWPQNYDGSYPIFCANRPGPKHPKHNLDITPNLTLLQHEWKKHGTCTLLTPNAFFAAEHLAFRAFTVPTSIKNSTKTITMKPSAILDAFQKANPNAPRGSIILWCSKHTLTSVSECLSKDLKPIACQGVKSCNNDTIDITRTLAPLH